MFGELGVFSILFLLEVLLGIDNIVFISIISARMQNAATIRWIGLLLALVLRLMMLLCVSFLFACKKPLFYSFSLQDILFICGGVFLLFKSLKELVEDVKPGTIRYQRNKYLAIAYIAFVDLIFSVDSLLTAVAITKNMFLIALVFILTILVMAFSASSVTKWIERFPELKVLALIFVASIGVVLLLDGFHIEFEKSYLYFGFGFSLFVQLCNIAKKSFSNGVEEV